MGRNPTERVITYSGFRFYPSEVKEIVIERQGKEIRISQVHTERRIGFQHVEVSVEGE